MPARQPFTALCQALARRRGPVHADLHLHTRHSDGNYTPAQLVDLACRSGLGAIALTDHDTVNGVAEAREAADTRLEVISAVEISAVWREREFHLLGYFVRSDDAALNCALDRLRAARLERFWEMVERLRACGVPVESEELKRLAGAGVLGRRHLAEWLVQARRAGSVREAFLRYLGDGGRVALPKVRLPVAEAAALVRGAGGVASWAHPSYDCTREALLELRGLGLGALEAEYPSHRPGRVRELRELAASLGLEITGGSDCHGPDEPRRAVGARGISEQELERLRRAKG